MSSKETDEFTARPQTFIEGAGTSLKTAVDVAHKHGAVAVVGYRTDGRFIVRNSWGTGWGDKDFGYVSPAYIAAGSFNESYGVTI